MRLAIQLSWMLFGRLRILDVHVFGQFGDSRSVEKLSKNGIWPVRIYDSPTKHSEEKFPQPNTVH
jgi:hypothetical protein